MQGQNANTNFPDPKTFASLSREICELLEGASALALSACAFAVGEKLAAARTAADMPDVQTLAELKAIYHTLSKGFQQRYFQDYAELDSRDIARLVHADKGDGEGSPADVRAMVDIYSAVWQLHYREFMENPAAALANWDPVNRYQTRAMRAVLFDMPYPELVKLALVMLNAVEDAQHGGNAAVMALVQGKRDILFTVLWQRAETPRDVAGKVGGSTNGEQLRGMLVRLLKETLQKQEQKKLDGFHAQVIPFAKPVAKR